MAPSHIKVPRGYYAPPLIGGALSDAFVWRLTYGWRLSVAYIGNNSRTARSRKNKIGTQVAHVTRDLDTTFKVKRSTCRGVGILWRTRFFFLLLLSSSILFFFSSYFLFLFLFLFLFFLIFLTSSSSNRWFTVVVTGCWSRSTNSVVTCTALAGLEGCQPWAGKPPRCVTSYPGQLSLAIRPCVGAVSTGDGYDHR